MIELRQLVFSYGPGAFSLRVPLLQVEAGEIVAVVGPSGAGKTTLLNLAAGITLPDSGSVVLAGTELSALAERQRREYRLARIGQVFQTFELLDYLDVRDNILLPARLGTSIPLDDTLRSRAAELAENLGIGDKLSRPVGQLSQGERQRVAVCRALLADPVLLLADEPTGNLDAVAKQQVLEALIRAAREHGASLLMVTHDAGLLGRFDRVVDMADFAGGP